MFIIFIKRYLNRLRILFGLFSIVLILLIARLYFLQVYPNKQVLSNYTNKQTENISDSKYTILDTNGKDMNKYIKKYIVVIDKKPFSLNNYENTLEELIAFNFIMKEEISDFNFGDIMASSGKVYYNISEETYMKIQKLKNLKGVYSYVRDELDKKYAWEVPTLLQNSIDEENENMDSLQSQIYRYTKDNQTIQRNFHLNNEAMYSENDVYISENNVNLKLTIDSSIEDKIRRVLDREEYKDYKNIGVIMLESDTGKIRALMQKDESSANVNLGIEGSGYEPGSVYKLITLSSALEMGITTMNDQYTCTGQICKSGAHGKITVNQALYKSCNDVFAQIGEKVSFQKILEYSKDVGLFDRVLNIEGETQGIEPKIEDGMNNIAIGQCLTVSPLQILGAINTIVNDGIYVKPYLIEGLLDYNNNTIKSFEKDSKKVFSKTTCSLVKEGMKNVVKEGTGKKANVPSVQMGGKTGTATGSGENNTHAWFVGYFKYQDKTYSMVIFVPNIAQKNEAGEELGGGNTAGPIFKDIVENIIETK